MPDLPSSPPMRGAYRILGATKLWPWSVLAALAGAALLLFPYTISGFLLTGDLRDVHLPAEAFYRRELRAGRIPYWDPLSALGFPVLASAQIGFWYPPLLALRALPPEPAIAVAIIAHVAFLALGMATYGRSLGMSRAGAALSALAFAGSGFVIGHLTQINILFGIAWLPWALLCVDRLATTLRWRWLGATSMLLALAALAGHFQIIFLLTVLCAVRLFARLRAAHRNISWQHTFWSWALLVALLVFLVVLLAAVQLFPTLELVRESTRGAGGGFDIARANQHSFPPWQAITFLLPGFYGFPDLSEYWGKRPQIEMTAWVGAIPLLLALIGAAGGKWKRSFWTITAVIGFLLALGRWSPFRLIGIEPTLGIFSGPARYLVLTEFAIALLAGHGLDRLRAASKVSTRAAGILGLTIAVLIVGGFIVLRASPESFQRLGERAVDVLIVGKPDHVLSRAAYSDKVTYLLGRLSTWGVNLRNPLLALSFTLLTTGSVVFIFRIRRGAFANESISTKKNLLRLLFIAATAFELVVIAWQVHPRVPWSEVDAESPVVATLADRPWGRLYIVHPQGDTGLILASPTTTSRDEHERLLRDLAVTNIFTRSQIPGIEWPAALDLSTASTVLNRLRDADGHPSDEGLLDRLAARYVAASSQTSHFRLRPEDKQLTTFPSADGATIAVWERPTARPRVEVFEHMPRGITDALPDTVGAARITTETPQRIHIAVVNPTDQPAVLLLRDTYYPGWQATLDGQLTIVTRADTLFRSVTIPPAEHTVTFTYRPTFARAGIATSGVTWTLMLGALLVRSAKRTVDTATGEERNHA